MYESLLRFPTDLFAELDRMQREMQGVGGLRLPLSIRAIGRGAFPAINIGSTPTSIQVYAFAPGTPKHSPGGRPTTASTRFVGLHEPKGSKSGLLARTGQRLVCIVGSRAISPKPRRASLGDLEHRGHREPCGRDERPLHRAQPVGGGTSNYLISPCGGQANELVDISDRRAEFSAVYARH
jgi:hypothetical protein